MVHETGGSGTRGDENGGPARTRIGVLYPGVGVAEDDYALMLEMLGADVDLSIVHTAVPTDRVDVDALRALGEDRHLLDGVEELRPTRASVAMWACTSGSFLWGLGGATRQAALIAAGLGVPASSSSLAFLAALTAVGARRVSLASPYTTDVARAFEGFLATGGVTTVKRAALEASTAAEISTFGRQALLDIVERSDSVDADAVVVPDTALHTAAWLEDAERLAGKTVLTSNQVTIWEALRLAGLDVASDRLGRLFFGAVPR